MSELTLMLIRFAYLAILWIFVLAVVIDTLIMFGGRLLTPWTRATSTGRVKATAAA